MDLQLKGKVVLITGAAGGIGGAMALSFAAEGAEVIGVDLKPLPSLSAGLRGKMRYLQASVQDAAAMQKLMENIIDERGALDILVNNAGISRNLLADRFTEKDYEEVLSVNVRSIFEISRRYFKMRKKQGGVIVNIASVLALIGAPLGILYGASKGAVLAMTRSMAMEWAKYNFRVNAICPGMTITAMTERVQKNKNMREANLQDIPMKRFASPAEIADVSVFLASERASYITGQAIVVDGGFTTR